MRRPETVGGILRAAIDAGPSGGRRPPRHPADVTADRLVDHSIEWTHFDGREHDAIGVVIHALREIADGDR